MAHTQIRASNRRLLGIALERTATIFAAFTAWQRTVARRRAIADLTAEQLKDIGHPEAPRPILYIKAGLVTNLMSMR
jgi:uncharacterized protein YjiS (DUF1127 family)